MKLKTQYSKRLTTLVLLLALLSPAVVGAQASSRLTVNRLEVGGWPDMALNITMLGPDGKALPGVDASHFEVREQGQPQSFQGIELGASRSVPLALVLTMDVSGSMNAGDKLGQAKTAANTFFGSLRPDDRAALLAFNDRVQGVVPPTNDRAALQAGVDALQGGGNTAIYDALYESVAVLDNAPADKRRVVILLTDGTDTSSKHSAPVAADIARNAGVLVYTIGLGPDPNDAVLKSLSEPGGGKYFKAPSAADLDAIYKAISIELNAQLILKFRSNTHVERVYQVVNVEVRYNVPGGQALVDAITYRPPPAAVLPSQPAAVVRQPPAVVDLPPGLRSGAGAQTAAPASIRTGVALGLPLLGFGVAALVGFTVLLGTLGLAALLVPSLLPTATNKRVERYLFKPGIGSAGRPLPDSRSTSPSPWLALLGSLGKTLARLSPKGYTSEIERQLVLTGPPYRMTVVAFLGIQLLLSVLTLALVLLWVANSKTQTPAQWALAAIVGLAIGGYLPYFWLKRRVKRRQKRVLRALPGALDFLAINVEAGLGFDAALTQVVKRWHNTLTDEFALLLIDFQIGKARKESWKDLIRRTQVPDLTSFITAMLQNEQVGVSISTLLRTQADQMRVKRRQAAEEAARTAPVKMLIPMVFCIFPGIFVIVLGPAVPQLLGTFMNFGGK